MSTGDFEPIDMVFEEDAELECDLLTVSEYAQVIFHDIEESYPTAEDITCQYTLTTTMTPKSGDIVGLYKVGWVSSHHAICKVKIEDASDNPEDTQDSLASERAVTFHGDDLPSDSLEYYQFCYVTSTSQMRGASTPFQIKNCSIISNNNNSACDTSKGGSISLGDFEAIEDPSQDGLMVVKSRLDILREDLLQAAHKNKKLQEKVDFLEEERDQLIAKLVEYDEALCEERQMNEATSEQLRDLQEDVAHYQEKMKDITVHNGRMQEKINFLNQEISSGKSRLDDSDKYICSLQEKIKHLVSEKDSLTGNNKMLEQEKQLLKEHIAALEQDSRKNVTEVTLLKSHIDEQKVTACEQIDNARVIASELSDARKKLADLQTHSNNLEQQVLDGSKKIETITSENRQDKVKFQRCAEQLQATEDKLSAALKVKEILEKERTDINSAHGHVMNKLQSVTNECHGVKAQMKEMRKRSELDAHEQTVMMSKLSGELNIKNQQIESLDAMILKLENEMSDLHTIHDEQKSALYSMKQAQSFLQQKLTETQQKVMQYQTDLQTKEEEYQPELLADVVNELKDTRERLVMGKEEYKKKFLECTKLSTENRKLKRHFFRQSSRSMTVSADEPEVNTVEQKTQTTSQPLQSASTAVIREQSVEASSTDSRESSPDVHPSPAATTDSSEVVSDLQEKLNKCLAKKRLYKDLYRGEKSKNASMQEHYHEEMKCKTRELNAQRDEIEALRMKIRSLISPTQSIECDESSLRSMTMSLECYNIPASIADNLSNSTTLSQRQLSPPLTPLPPPMRPEVLPSAKIASVKAVNAPIGHTTVPFFPQALNDDQFVDASDQFVFDGSEAMASGTAPETTEYHTEEAADEQAAVEESAAPPTEFFPAQASEPLFAPLEASATDCATYEVFVPTTEQYPPSQKQEVEVISSTTMGDFVNIDGETGFEAEESAFSLANDDQTTYIIDSQVSPTAPFDDGYEPILGTDKVCPVCEELLDADMDQATFEDHVDAHYGRSCPVCHAIFKVNLDVYEAHVQDHFVD